MDKSPKRSDGTVAAARPTWYLVGISILEGLSYLNTNYAADTITTVFIWVAISAFAIWKIWRGSRAAWLFLAAITIATVPLVMLSVFGVIHTGQSGLWLSCRIFIVIAEILLLAAPQVRRWVDGEPVAFDETLNGE